MKAVEMKKNFKTKSGFTRVLLTEKGYGDKIKYKRSLCYPAVQEEKYVEYVQDAYEMTKEEANKMFLRLKKQGYEYTITK